MNYHELPWFILRQSSDGVNYENDFEILEADPQFRQVWPFSISPKQNATEITSWPISAYLQSSL